MRTVWHPPVPVKHKISREDWYRAWADYRWQHNNGGHANGYVGAHYHPMITAACMTARTCYPPELRRKYNMD